MATSGTEYCFHKRETLQKCAPAPQGVVFKKNRWEFFGVFSSKSLHFVPLWARSSFFLRSRQFSGPGLADKCQKTITEITGGPNVLVFASNFANSELSSGSCELIRRSRRSTGFPGSGTEAADRTLGNTRRSLRMT